MSNGQPTTPIASGVSVTGEIVYDNATGIGEYSGISYTINNLAPVPLPAAAWLLLSGLGGLGWLRRRSAAG